MLPSQQKMKVPDKCNMLVTFKKSSKITMPVFLLFLFQFCYWFCLLARLSLMLSSTWELQPLQISIHSLFTRGMLKPTGSS